MKPGLISITILGTCVLMMLGCKKPVDVSGSYVGSIELQTLPDGEEADILTSLAQSTDLKLVLNKDMTFREEYVFFVLEGSYSADSTNLVLNPEFLNGVNVAEVADQSLRSQAVPKVFRLEEGRLIRSSEDGEYKEIYRRRN